MAAIVAVAQLTFGPVLASDRVSGPALAWHDGATEISLDGQDTADGLGGRVTLATKSHVLVASAEGSALMGETPDLGWWWQKSEGALGIVFPAVGPLDLRLSAGAQTMLRYSGTGQSARSSGMTAAIKAKFNLAAHTVTDVALSREADHALRLEVTVTQGLGRAQLVAKASADRFGTATEIGGTASAPSPVNVSMRGREKAVASLQIPLDKVGLPKSSLNIAGDWRVSRVEDPTTHRSRRLSGEKPYVAHIELKHVVTPTVDIGLRSDTCGPVDNYMLRAVSVDQPSVDVSAFLRYRPGPFEVDLNARTAVTAQSETIYPYQEPPGDSTIARAEVRRIRSSALTLELKQQF